jgi:phosphoglycolate phosphatase-like HAD superfamily hydrolase
MQYLPSSTIEIVKPDIPRGAVKHALFDFDGTLSLIREGWQKVMVGMMVDILMQTPQHESRDELECIVRDFVDRLTGKQTIYQMLQLAEEVRIRGLEPRDPLDYKHQYLDLLWEQIKHRVQGLRAGTIPPSQMLVPGSLEILRGLRERGVTCYLASGTDIPYVRDESDALGLHPYFGEHIYGALDDWKTFSKAMLIQRIIQQHQLQGAELLAFGDGYVEIENTVEVGGIAVGVATDERHPGAVDAWKRERLIQAGAMLIMPDFRQTPALLAYLFAED